MAIPLTIIIVEKSGILKTLSVKDYKEDELYKKCGFKKPDNFTKQTCWNVKLDSKYVVYLYAKKDGKANTENKYDFPPPVDNDLYFGSCALVCFEKDKLNKLKHCNLSIELWNKIYEKLFGGFEDLNKVDDEEEEDELKNVPKTKKTKVGGYLKDGFVVDDDCEDSEDEYETCSEDDNSSEEIDNELAQEVENNLILEDIGSELSEESYDYSD